jgi:GAF domain-containing protein/CheY-like chemotaxis protein
VPILVGETFLGVLDFIVQGRAATREEQELLQLLAAHAGIAIQNAARYEGERRQGERLRGLADVNRRISSALELDVLLETIAQSAANLSGVSYASFWLADDARRMLTFSGGSDPAFTANLPRSAYAYGEGGVGWVAEHRRVLAIDDLETDPRIRDRSFWLTLGMRAGIAYPVLSGDDLLAVLLLSHVQPLRFGSDTQAMIELFTAQAAVAIQNARLYRDATRRRDMAEALANLGRELTGTLDVARIEEIVTRGMVTLLRARGGAVHRYSPVDGTLTTTTAFGPDAEAVRGLVMKPGEGGSGLAVQQRQLVVSPDLLNDPRISLPADAGDRLANYEFRAIMAAPLIARDRILGVLAIGAERGREFTADERQVFQAFADQAALALENARLYAESERERREASTLAAAARQLASSLDIDELGGQLVEVLRQLIGAHASALYRIRQDGELVSVGFAGAARAHMRVGEVVDPRAGITRRAVAERRPVWTRDVLNDPDVYLPDEYRAAITLSGTRAVLSVPLIVKSEVVGVLAISDAVPRDFEPREIALLEAFADQAALALENARLYASARESLARLRDTQVQLVQAAKMSALGQLVSGVAHELNNPLSVVIGYGQLLLGRELPPDLKRPVDLMVSQGDRMAKIVRNLLYFARQRPPERVPTTINRVVEETLALRLHQLTLSGIALERHLAADLPPIPADGQQLQQVFLNLLLNAEQAILEAGSSGRIIVRTALADEGRAVRAEVVDNGPGIPTDVLPHVFEPFYTTKEVGAGTGLGLSVSYGIVQEHGGRLSVESRPGETVFIVELPIVPEASTRRTAPAPPPPRSVIVSDRVALIVEDEPHVSDLISMLLEETGWQVDVATGGRRGLERLRERRHDLVVSDMRMPDGNGDEFYRGAIAHDAALAERFMFLTGDTANAAAWEFLQHTRAPVLEKPFAAAVFLDAVRRLITS